MHALDVPLATPSAVLIAADKMSACQLLQDWLTREYPRCRVLHVANPKDARNIALAERPEVILVDIDMPDTRGFEILRVLRTELPDAHLIALSLFDAEVFREYAAGAGAKACLSMAVGDSRLKELIGALLASPHGRPSA